MPIQISKEVKTTNVLAVFISFLIPITVSLLTKQEVTTEAIVYALVNGTGGIILVSIHTTYSLIKKTWEIICDTKMSPEQKISQLQAILPQIMQAWELSWQQVSGIFNFLKKDPEGENPANVSQPQKSG